MSNNLRKFSTEADYTSATLNYPAVSWVVSGDTVHFDKSAPTPPVANDKVMMGFRASNDGGSEIAMYNCGTSNIGLSIDAITINDVSTDISNCSSTERTTSNTWYTVKYTLANDGTYIGEWFSGELGEGGLSSPNDLELFFPAQITEMVSWPDNTKVVVCQASTPPVLNINASALELNGIYVPDESVNAYKANASWQGWQEIIYPISDYAGNLPI